MSERNSNNPHLPGCGKVSHKFGEQSGTMDEIRGHQSCCTVKGKDHSSKSRDSNPGGKAKKAGGSGIVKSGSHSCVEDQNMFLDIFKDQQAMNEALDMRNIFGSEKGKGSQKKRGDKSVSTTEVYPLLCSSKERKVMSGKQAEEGDRNDNELEQEESEEDEDSSEEENSETEGMDDYFKDIGKMLYYSFFKKMEQNLKSQNLHSKPGKLSKRSYKGKLKSKRKPTAGLDSNGNLEAAQQTTYKTKGILDNSGAGEKHEDVSDLEALSPSIPHKVVDVNKMIAEKSNENDSEDPHVNFPGKKSEVEETSIESLSPSISHKVIPLNEMIAEKNKISFDAEEVAMGIGGLSQAADGSDLPYSHSKSDNIKGGVQNVSQVTIGNSGGNKTIADHENPIYDIGQIVEEIQSSGPESRKGMERYFGRGRSQKRLTDFQAQKDHPDPKVVDESRGDSLRPSTTVGVGTTSFPTTSGNTYQSTPLGKYDEGQYLKMRQRGGLPQKKKILMEALASQNVGQSGTGVATFGLNEPQQQQFTGTENTEISLPNYQNYSLLSGQFGAPLPAVTSIPATYTAPLYPGNSTFYQSADDYSQQEKPTTGTLPPEKEINQLESHLPEDSSERLVNVYDKGVTRNIQSPPGTGETTSQRRHMMLGQDENVVDVTDEEYFNSDHVRALARLSGVQYPDAESYENAIHEAAELLRHNFVRPECKSKLVSLFGPQILEKIEKDGQIDGEFLMGQSRVSEDKITEGSKDTAMFRGVNAPHSFESGASHIAPEILGQADKGVSNEDVEEIEKYLEEGTCGPKCLKRMEGVYGKGIQAYVPDPPGKEGKGKNIGGRVVTLGEDGQVKDITEEHIIETDDIDRVKTLVFKDHTTKESYEKGLAEIKEYLSRNAVLPGSKKRLESIYGKGIIDAFEEEIHLVKVLKAMDEKGQQESATFKSPTAVTSELQCDANTGNPSSSNTMFTDQNFPKPASSMFVHSGGKGDVQETNVLNEDANVTNDSVVEVCNEMMSHLDVSGINDNKPTVNQGQSYQARHAQPSWSKDLSRPTTGYASQKRRFHQRDTLQRLNSYDKASPQEIIPLERSIGNVSSTNSDFFLNSKDKNHVSDTRPTIASPISDNNGQMPFYQSTGTNLWMTSDNQSLRTDSDISGSYTSRDDASSSSLSNQIPNSPFTYSDPVESGTINFMPSTSPALFSGETYATSSVNSDLSYKVSSQDDHSSELAMDTTTTDFDFLLNSPIIPLSPNLEMPGTSPGLSLPSTSLTESVTSKPDEIRALSEQATISTGQSFDHTPNTTGGTVLTIADASSQFGNGITFQVLDKPVSHEFVTLPTNNDNSQLSSSCSTNHTTSNQIQEDVQTVSENESKQNPAYPTLLTPESETEGRYFPVTLPPNDHSFQTFISLNPDSPNFSFGIAHSPPSPLQLPETANEKYSDISNQTSKQSTTRTNQPSMTFKAPAIQVAPQIISGQSPQPSNSPATTALPNQPHDFFASSLLLSLIPKASEAKTTSASPLLRNATGNTSSPASTAPVTVKTLLSGTRPTVSENSFTTSSSAAVISTPKTYLLPSSGISSSSTTSSKGDTSRTCSSQQERKLPPCRICGEKASGYHFGVNSCEACNEFYRRTLKQNKIYFCAREENCDVSGAKRNSCSFCRFQRCLKAGMSRDRIKTGRYSHKKKTLDALELKQLDEMNRPSLDAKSLDEKIEELKNVFASFYTLEQTQQSSAMSRIFGGDSSPASLGYSSLYNSSQTFTNSRPNDQGRGDTSAVGFPKNSVGDFVRDFLRLVQGIPGFSSLCSQDQSALNRKSWLEFWMLSEFTASGNDIQIPTQTEILLLYSEECKNVMGAEFVKSMTHCCNRIRSMNLTRTVFMLMKVLVVTSPDCVMLIHKNEVENLNRVYVQCLLHELGKPSSQGGLTQNTRSSDQAQLFSEIMDVQNELRTVVRSYDKMLSPTSVPVLFQ